MHTLVSPLLTVLFVNVGVPQHQFAEGECMSVHAAGLTVGGSVSLRNPGFTESGDGVHAVSRDGRLHSRTDTDDINLDTVRIILFWV